MIRFAVLAASVQRAFSSIAMLAVLGAAPALAGDRALFEPLGYTRDFSHFAFEEYSMQDGSGFPYANIYVIDLAQDRWVSGTPIRARLETDGDTIAMARAQARADAEPVLVELGLDHPAHLIALNGDGEFGNGQTLDFGAAGYLPGQVVGSSELALEQFEAGSPHDCQSYPGEPAKGYALTLTTDGASRELHRDGAMLPASRGCATDYRLYGVVAPMNSGSLDGGVAIVGVYPFGFEGPDRRFLAVPLQ